MRTGRRIVVRLLSWNPWLEVFLRGVNMLRDGAKFLSAPTAAPSG
ncbi:MAG: hypothetical protein AABZ47_02255 [Planctomycetota bacterium]